MNITQVFSDIVTAWNEESKCGFCWEFAGRLRESDLNEYQQKTDECCVIVAITDYTWSYINQYNRVYAQNIVESKQWGFNLHILSKDNLGLNMYDEILNHPLNESKWFTILQPLEDCIITPVDFCEFTNQKLEVVNWGNAREKIDWLDMNYTGWTINVQLRNNNL